MTLFTIPLRYIRAKWLRTGLLIAVFALGIVSMTGLWQVSALVGESFERKLINYGANILVTPRRDTLTVSYGGYSLGDVTLEERLIDIAEAYRGIDAMPLRANVAVVAPKLLASTRLEGQAVAVVGVDWSAELILKGYWDVSGDLPATDGSAELLIGSRLGAQFGIQPGQTLRVEGRDFRVSGLINTTGSDDDSVIFAPLGFVQDFSGKPGQASFLEVAALCSGCPIADIVEQLQAAMPGTEVNALRQVAHSRMYAIEFAQNLAFYVSLVILATACAMIIMSMLSAVAERRKEIGIMRAVGFSRSSVFMVFVAEAVGIGVLAGLIGYLAGHLLAGYVLAQLQLDDVSGQVFSFAPFLGTVAVAAVAVALAAAFPAWKASLVEPAEALVSL
jgi:putative ABC transport system permease protein